jgi:lipoyl(octanoyl) transferase
VLLFHEGDSRYDRLYSKTFSSSSRLFLVPQQLGTFEVLDADTAARKIDRRVVLENYSGDAASGGISFDKAWNCQKECLDQHVQRLKNEATDMPSASTSGSYLPKLSSTLVSTNDNPVPLGLDTVFMLQHSPVYTLGTGSDEKFVLHNDKVPTIRMDRGGEVTYHGPGQLTVYPILDLRNYRQDIHWYMRALEESILVAISKVPGVPPGLAVRQEDTTGIWMNNFKVAAVGIKCRKWITMHGVAVNVEATSLENFDGIVPCGLEGRKVGCLNQFLEAYGAPLLTVEEFSKYMVEAMEEVFCIELINSKSSRLLH